LTDDPITSPRYFIAGIGFDAPVLAPGLYVVATPIGNLGDMTLRGLETLAAADLVLCEDTRTSGHLLTHFGIRTRRAALHEHNERSRIEPLLERLRGGARIALISDAGTPLLSDPGFPLVRAARDAGIAVFAVPGASALLAALAVAGLPTDSFSFHGFLPVKATGRRRALAELVGRRETQIFYESPRRLAASLAAMAEILGADREAAVALELTKRFERLSRGPLATLAAEFAQGETRGEAVILVTGAPATEPSAADWQGALAAALAQKQDRAAEERITAENGHKRKKDEE
jgi:16S rRNA (cytidine1402-2'-O)-methyltransferase